jgi:hypothetical protein
MFSPGWLTHDPKTANGPGKIMRQLKMAGCVFFARRTFQFFCSSVKFAQNKNGRQKPPVFVVNSRS